MRARRLMLASHVGIGILLYYEFVCGVACLCFKEPVAVSGTLTGEGQASDVAYVTE